MKLTAGLIAAVAAALATAVPAAAFTPPNQYYAKQWYLGFVNAFSAWQTPPTGLAPVKVAIIDSGVDCSLPDFAGRIAAKRSFVGGSACTDTVGHGTIVAGEIAGDLGTNGIVGIAYNAQLVVAKVVRPDETVPLAAEAAAIRWAANQGARVINLSFGAVRDPRNRAIDSYSAREANAVAYAYSKGAVIVAAAGNSDEASATTWPWADYPAALPHVIGVAALDQSGNVPSFSDRDPRYVDLAAPGVAMFSTFPAALTALRPSCTPQGYTACANPEYSSPEGTSFAAPQVSAAAAVLFSLDPSLTNSQVRTILEQTATDVTAATGCPVCPVGHDEYSGWGSLDVANAVAALSKQLPVQDRYEPNDDVSLAKQLWGRQRSFRATLSYYNDPIDVYSVLLRKGQQIKVRADASWSGARFRLILWRPGTRTVLGHVLLRKRAAASVRPGQREHVLFRARSKGWYYVELKVTAPGGGSYTMQLTKTPPPKAKHS
jgi:subtilisin family serine protease